MNVIAFLGSPRKGGNTETLLAEAVRGTGQDVKLFRLQGMKISPCLNCGGCDETGVCIVEDDMVEVAQAIREADRIILASPIFFMSVSAQTKGMIDRCQAFWCEKYLLKKTIPAGAHGRKGLVILVGGMKKERGIACASVVATAFMRTVSVPGHQTLMHMGVDAKGDILKRPDALKQAYEAGRKLVA